eukprot:Pompholyxophrys_punicea_v1_NODE_460_length_1909_cov_7.339266.p1 type:complete len:229 gc:universal NODE_460_length_1909_cov_7.339266:778-1464(+)
MQNFSQKQVRLSFEDFNDILDAHRDLEIRLSNLEEPSFQEKLQNCVKIFLERKKEKKVDIFGWDALMSVLDAEDSSGEIKKFFQEIYDSCSPMSKNEKIQALLKQRVVVIVHQLMYASNKHPNMLQRQFGLRSASKVTTESMQNLHALGLAPSHQSVHRDQVEISSHHADTVEKFWKDFHDCGIVMNLDDYTDIWAQDWNPSLHDIKWYTSENSPCQSHGHRCNEANP